MEMDMQMEIEVEVERERETARVQNLSHSSQNMRFKPIIVALLHFAAFHKFESRKL